MVDHNKKKVESLKLKLIKGLIISGIVPIISVLSIYHIWIKDLLVDEIDKQYFTNLEMINERLNSELMKPIEISKKLNLESDIEYKQLDWIVESFDYIENIRVLDVNKKIIHVSPNLDYLVGTTDYSSIYLIKDAEIPLTSVYISELNNQPAITYYISKGNKTILIDVNLNHLDTIKKSIISDSELKVDVINEFGNYIYSSDFKNVSYRNNYKNFDLIKKHIRENKFKANERVVYFLEMNLIKGSLILEIESSFVYSSITKFENLFYLLLIIMAVMLTLTSNKIIGKINKSITYLENRFHNVVIGDFKNNEDVYYFSEFKSLTRDFEVMKLAVYQREEEIKLINNNLENAVKDRTYELEELASILEEEIEAKNEAYLEIDAMYLKLEDLVEIRTEELRNTSMKLKEVNNQLKEEIQEKERFEIELIEAKQKAEQSSQAKTVFLSNMSHEIRTPLNGMIGIIEVLRRMQLNEKANKYVNTLNESSLILLEILNQILDYSKISSSNIELNEDVFNLQKLINDICKLFKLSAEIKGISLVTSDLSSLSNNYIGDSLKIKQIISNIIGNGIKFTSNGYVKVEAREIFESESTFVEIIISDTGVGIPDYKLKDIFERFEQVSDTTEENVKGTGLGLAISKNLIDIMGGKINVKSKIGSGTSFMIVIPIIKAENEIIIESRSDSKISSYFGIKALIIDDDYISSKVLSELLSLLGIESEISNGELNDISHKIFDVIFCDYSLSGKNSIALINKIKMLNEGENIIIGISGYSPNEIDIDNWGVDDFIQKPINLDSLIKILNKRLDESSSIDVLSELKVESQSNGDQNQIFERLKSSTKFNDEFIVEIISDYIEVFEEYLNNLYQLIKLRNFEGIKEVIHKLKGSSMNIRDERTIKTCECFEMKLSMDELPSECFLNDIEHLSLILLDLKKSTFFEI